MKEKMKLTELTQEELRQVTGGKMVCEIVVCRCVGHPGPPDWDFTGDDNNSKIVMPRG